MKIVLVGTAYPYRGGLALFNERLMEQFYSEGDQVEIQTFSLQYPPFLFPGKTQYSESKATHPFKIERTVNSINPLSWIKVGLSIRKSQADIVVIKYWLPFMAPCLGSIARLAGGKKTKVVAIADNILPHERRFFDNAFTKYFVKSVDAWVAMSRKVLEDISLFDKSSPRTLTPHPLFDNFGEKIPKEEAIRLLGLDSTKVNLLFFGLVREYKGLDILLQAMKDQRLADIPLHLTVAGEFYDDYSKYERMLADYGLGERVSMENKFVKDEDVSKYFCACDLVVLPYKSATQSGVTQIAFHFSKPMLVTEVGGLPEIVCNGKSGYVCSPNAESIASCIEDFCTKGRDFSSSLETEKQRFAWNKMTEAIRKVYKESINRNDSKK